MQLINILHIKLKSYKVLTYFLLLSNLYTSYNFFDEINYKDNYQDCISNLTDSNTYINQLIHDNNELINHNEAINHNIHFSFINMFQNNKFYQCLFPEYYVDKCINYESNKLNIYSKYIIQYKFYCF